MRSLFRLSLFALSLWAGLGRFAPGAHAGMALLFDGTNDVVTIAGFGNVIPTNEITIEFWQRVDRVKAQAPLILNPDVGTNRFVASTPYSDGRVYWDYGNFTNRGRLGYQPAVSLTNSWQHFALVTSVSGGFMRVYRNGILEASTNTSSSYARSGSALLLGGSAVYRFGGMLDEVRVWNTVRSVTQLQTNMNRTLTGTESNLVAYWRFDETAGTVVSDSSGNGRNGTVSRSNAWVFSTAPIGMPSATTFAAVNVTANSATLTGTVFTANQTTPSWFEYGTTPALGASTATTNLAPTTNTLRVSRVLSGLSANTAYHFRLVATNGGGADAGAAFSFATPAARPAVSTLAANAVTATGARLRATVNPNGLETVAWFEYGLSTNYGTVGGATNLGPGVSDITFSNVVASLLPGRTYNFRVVATNDLGTNFGGNRTLSTPPAAPLVTTLSAENVAATSARLVGSVNPNGAATRFFFRYGLTTNYGSTTTSSNLSAGNISITLTGAVASLLPGNLYHFRAVATNVAGTNLGADLSFITPPLRPLVSTLAATGVNTSNAVFNATVNPNGAATDLFFEYGPTTNYGSRTVVTSLPFGNTNDSISNLVSGLSAGTTYHVRAVATNSAGASLGVDVTFSTAASGGPPITSCVREANGRYRLTFTGTAGGTYTVMVSTNLSQWSVLGTPSESPPGLFQFLDTNAPSWPRRFYQLRSP